MEEFEAIHYNPDSNAGGQFVVLHIPYELIAEAKVLLNEPCLSVTEIAELLNFADQSYLSRFFKKNTGMSPKEFRLQKLL